MANKLKDTAANVLALARTFQSVIDLAQAVDEIGGIEQAEAKARQRNVATQKETQGIQAELATATSDLKDAKAAVKKAQQDAEGIITQAKQDAQSIVVLARTDGATALKEATDAKKAVEAETAKKQKALKELNSEIEGRQAVLNSVNDEIDAIKAKASKIAS